jgi:ubiquinone/menaquinone biosynthesis C-methylase UbiE
MLLKNDGPGVLLSQDMVRATNKIYPFASALTVLDVGCGVGEITNSLIGLHGPELPQSSRLISSDLSPGVIAQLEVRKAEEIAKRDTTWSKVETSVSNIQDLSAVPDNSASHVCWQALCSSWSLSHAPL